MHDFPDVKVENSGQTDTLLSKQAVQNPGSKRTFTKQPIYLPPLQNTKGTLVPNDAWRTWEAAVVVSPGWLYEKNMCPPSADEHAAMKKMNVSAFLGRPPLRAKYTQTTEPARLSRAIHLLPSVEDIYLGSLNFDLQDQFQERYALLTGETSGFALNSRYSRDLDVQPPMPKERLQRARYAS